MDWNLKANSWGLGEFEQEAITGIDAFHRPSGIADHNRRGDFSIDLKLGGIGKSSVGESVSKWKQQPGPGVSKLLSSPSSSTKRARGGNNGIQVVTCLVDGCNSDLSACRDYHRRHKVCELHSKTPQVTICGQKQRFCQQCSRFHSLEEFDEGKRSCRKRLDGHNRRRRKPQPDPLSRSASFLSNFQGSQLFPFSGSHAYPSNSMTNPCWSGGVVSNSAADTRHYNLHQQIPLIPNKHNLFLGSSSSSHHKEGKQFSFLQSSSSISSNSTNPEAGSVCQPVLGPFAYPEISSSGGGGSSSSHNMYCERLTTQAQVRESDCALSLLSSRSSHMVQQPNSIPLVQYSIAPAATQVVHHDHCSSSLDSVLVSSDRDAHHDVHCDGMFHIRSGVSSGNKASQLLPFSWD